MASNVGDRFVNLSSELDEDERGAERVTAPGNEWVLESIVHIDGAGTATFSAVCAATGAAICPDETDLERDFRKVQ
jgi:hypothetical protein